MDLAIRIERVVVFSEGHPPYLGRRPAGTVGKGGSPVRDPGFFGKWAKKGIPHKFQ